MLPAAPALSPGISDMGGPQNTTKMELLHSPQGYKALRKWHDSDTAWNI